MAVTVTPCSFVGVDRKISGTSVNFYQNTPRYGKEYSILLIVEYSNLKPMLTITTVI
jgi:hypothetical protein